MRSLSEINTLVGAAFGNATPAGTIYINVTGSSNTVGGKYNSTPSLLATNTNPTPTNYGYYEVANSGFTGNNSKSFAVLPFQIWNDSNTDTRRTWLYLKGPYSNGNSLSFTTSGKILYQDIRTFDSDPETVGYYSNTASYNTPKIGGTYDFVSPWNSLYGTPPSQEFYITVLNGTNSPNDVRNPVTYNTTTTVANSSVIKSNTTVTGSLDFTIKSDALFLDKAESFTPSPNNYTRQVDFVSGSTIANAAVIPRQQQTWTIG